MTDIKISINGVSFGYQNAYQNTYQNGVQNTTMPDSRSLVLHNITAEIPAGQFVCVLGQSGCGKSTLLRLIAGLSLPHQGTLTIDGKTVSGPERKCSVVFQDYSLFPWMTTGKNLTLALSNAYPEKPRAEIRLIAEEYLAAVGLPDKCFHLFPGALSGGMRQRAAIARVLACGAPILLLDEPFGALDPMNRILLQDLLLKLWRDGAAPRTVIFVTHDIDEAVYLSQRIIVLGSSPGRIIADWQVPHKLYDKSGGQHDFRYIYDRTVFELPEIKTFQHKLLSLYREDILRRLESGSVQQNGTGI